MPIEFKEWPKTLRLLRNITITEKIDGTNAAIGILWIRKRRPIKRSIMYADEIAQVCHEANRALQIAQNDPAPSPHWNEAPAWQKESAVEGVLKALAGSTPEGLHESWCEFKERDGWVYGPAKDADAKTHPCLVPYSELPNEQKLKDQVFSAIVSALG